MEKTELKKLVEKRLSIREISNTVGKAQTTVRYWLSKYNLKTYMSDPENRRSWTDTELEVAVNSSISLAEVLLKLDLEIRPGNYRTINKYIERNKLDVSHMSGKACGRGSKKLPLSEILVENSDYRSTSNLKKRLLKEGLLENKCSECGLESEWQGKPIVMVLDHINGTNNDNRRENLRLLCPNCNSQQPTFCRGGV